MYVFICKTSLHFYDIKLPRFFFLNLHIFPTEAFFLNLIFVLGGLENLTVHFSLYEKALSAVSKMYILLKDICITVGYY